MTHKNFRTRMKRLEMKGPLYLKGLKKVMYFADYAKQWNASEALDYLKLFKKHPK